MRKRNKMRKSNILTSVALLSALSIGCVSYAASFDNYEIPHVTVVDQSSIIAEQEMLIQNQNKCIKDQSISIDDMDGYIYSLETSLETLKEENAQLQEKVNKLNFY